jgi:phage terminase large subunit-like protein
MTFDAFRTDPTAFIDDFLPLNEAGRPWALSDYQRRVFALVFRFTDDGVLSLLRYLLWGEVKKSGKTLLAAALGLWWAYTRSNTEIVVVANDLDQSVGRVFKTMTALIRHNSALAASATVRATTITLSNGTLVEAIPSDYQGEAGRRHSLVIFDELWGVMSERARRLFEELTPPPTEPEAWGLIVTTAGFSGESELLEALYQTGLRGERISEDLEVYRAGTLTMFWSHTPRQAWQTAQYYAEQKQTLRPNAFRRLHLNEWVTGTESFINAEDWDACVDSTLTPVIGSPQRSTVYGVDVAPKHDYSAVVGVQIEGDIIRLASHRIWKPTPADPIDLEATIERYLLDCRRRGNMAAVVCDPFQMHSSIMRLKKVGLPIRELPQTVGNTTAFSQALYDAIRGRSLRMYHAPDLREQALNAVAVETGRGWRLAKEKASRKIDAIVALALAVHAAIAEASKPALGPGVAVILPSTVSGSGWQDRYFSR